MRTLSLFLRSLFWTLLFPGFFAGFLPWWYFGLSEVDFNARNLVHLAGTTMMALGTALLVICIVNFARGGRGTLSPVDPPTQLVVQGPYRYVRNPMYVGVLAIVLGEILLTQSVALAIYWLIFLACANLFVVGYEEPHLRRTFGASYERYAAEVGRWIPGRANSAKRNAAG